MKAFILAGGLGTRLHPLTLSRPKPLLPFANVPLARHSLTLLQQQGIDDFTFLLHYLPEAFPALLGDGSNLGRRIRYVTISENLSTAGCLKFVERQIDQTALVFSADLVVDFDLKAMLQWHRQCHAQITLAIRSESSPVAYGVVLTDDESRIIRFQEKPTQRELFSNWMNCGIYLVEPGILKNFPAHVPLSFEKEVFPYYAQHRKALYGFPLAGYWRDIGTPSAYLQAHADFLDRKLPAIYYRHLPQAISANQNVIGAEVFIDSSCRIERSFIGAGCVVEHGAELRDAVLWEGVRVDRGARINSSIIASAAHIGADAEVLGHSLLATGAKVCPGARVGPNARITVEEFVPTYDSSLTMQAA